MATLNLSSWRSAMCGAEPIDWRILVGFAQRFASVGFDVSALTPCYGMAEATLCVSMKQMGSPVGSEKLLRDVLTEENRAVVATGRGAGAVTTVVDCGPAVEGTDIYIVDEAGDVLGDGEIGRIYLLGPSLMREYYAEPEKTRAAHPYGMLDTGDIGYLRNGHLFVLGRAKELIIIRGQNYYPTDFERAAAEVSGISLGRVAAVGIHDSAIATEALYIVCEVKELDALDQAELQQRVMRHVASRTGVPPAQVLLVPPRTLPRTTSGKLKRNALKTRLLAEAVR